MGFGLAWQTRGHIVSDGQNMRAALARLVRDHIDEMVDTINGQYNSAFPAIMPYYEGGMVDQGWTRVIVEQYADMIECGSCDGAMYLVVPFFTMEDPYCRELSQLSTFVSSALFHGRALAPIIFSHTKSGGMDQSRQMLRVWEKFIQDLVRANCDAFCERLAEPERLSREWSLVPMGPVPNQVGDTPAAAQSRPGTVSAAQTASSAVTPEGVALSNRERDVLALVVQGLTNRQIASELGVGQSTAKTYVARLFDKFNVNSRSALVARVLRGV